MCPDFYTTITAVFPAGRIIKRIPFSCNTDDLMMVAVFTFFTFPKTQHYHSFFFVHFSVTNFMYDFVGLFFSEFVGL
jgi:hypothetical protein